MTSLSESYFNQRFFADIDDVRSLGLGPVAQRMAALYGAACSDRLARLLDFCASRETRSLGELTLWPPQMWLPPESGNSFEFMMQEPFRLYALLGNAIALGDTGSGDWWWIGLQTGGDDHEVFLFDHALLDVHVVADGIATMAWLNRLIEDGRAAPSDIGELSGKVAFYNDVELEVELAQPLLASTDVAAQFSAGSGVAGLLLGQGGALSRSFVFDVDLAMASPLPAEPIRALWHLFFTGQDVLLERALTPAAAHPALLVRDAAELVRQLLADRERIQGVDLLGLRGRICRGEPALPPMPETRPTLDVGQHVDAGAACFEAQDYLGALAAFELVPASKRSGGVYSNMAYCYQALGRHAEALEAFEHATRLLPGRAHLYRAACYSHYALQQWQAMQLAAEQAVELDAGSDYAWQQLGIACQARLDDASAASAYRSALQLRPDNGYVAFNLGWVLWRLGDDGFVDAFARGLAHAPELRNQLAEEVQYEALRAHPQIRRLL